MTKISWKPGTLIAPLPAVMVSCGTMEKPNVMTAAWTGIINSEPPITYVSIRPSRYSHELVSKSGEFVINLTTLALAEAADYCGVKSGSKEDKLETAGLKVLPCGKISAPQIEQSPVSLECKVIEVKKYGSHDMFIAEILAINVDDKYIDESGKLDLERAGMLVYSHGEYFTMGRKLGSFGFSVNKKKTSREKPSEKPSGREDRKRGFSDRPKRDSSDKPRRDSNGEERSFKPRRDFSDKPRRDGAKGEGRGFKPREGSADKGERRFSDKPRKEFGERKSFSDRPRRDSNGEERSFKPRGAPSGRDNETRKFDRPAPVEKRTHKKFRNK